jgi:hypothetical protein
LYLFAWNSNFKRAQRRLNQRYKSFAAEIEDESRVLFTDFRIGNNAASLKDFMLFTHTSIDGCKVKFNLFTLLRWIFQNPNFSAFNSYKFNTLGKMKAEKNIFIDTVALPDKIRVLCLAYKL